MTALNTGCGPLLLPTSAPTVAIVLGDSQTCQTPSDTPVIAAVGAIPEGLAAKQRCSQDIIHLMRKGQTCFDAATTAGDLWSIGVLLYQLATSKLTFMDGEGASAHCTKRQAAAFQKALLSQIDAWQVCLLCPVSLLPAPLCSALVHCSQHPTL